MNLIELNWHESMDAISRDGNRARLLVCLWVKTLMGAGMSLYLCPRAWKWEQFFAVGQMSTGIGELHLFTQHLPLTGGPHEKTLVHCTPAPLQSGLPTPDHSKRVASPLCLTPASTSSSPVLPSPIPHPPPPLNSTSRRQPVLSRRRRRLP